jgi:hypothetical protein
VVSPNGGEKLSSGGNWTLVWGGPPEVTSYKLSYSPNNGLTWGPVTTGFITDTSVTWTLPAFKKNVTKGLVKVTAYTGTKKVSSDKSDGPFMIEVLTITEPTGCTSGGHCTIAWTKSPNVNADTGKLSYSTDGGLTWKMIVDTIAGTDVNHMSWTPVVGKTRKNCKVKLVYRDDQQKVVATAISNTFTIDKE